MPKHHRHHRGPHGHGRKRARRGAVGRSILTLLAEKPMNGYELMAELDERSGGRWQPSSGSIYPALKRLEQRGFISAATSEDDDKPRYELTDEGRQRLEAFAADGETTPPWEGDVARHGEIRGAMAELMGPARQIGRFGSADQITAATTAIKDTTSKLYQILADGPGEE
ncbi:MAG: PadR family transcriptional regulator [Ilumatobacter sp.]|nr:PadR family transcriptional regulator [Ilumatobacter sp.]